MVQRSNSNFVALATAPLLLGSQLRRQRRASEWVPPPGDSPAQVKSQLRLCSPQLTVQVGIQRISKCGRFGRNVQNFGGSEFHYPSANAFH